MSEVVAVAVAVHVAVHVYVYVYVHVHVHARDASPQSAARRPPWGACPRNCSSVACSSCAWLKSVAARKDESSMTTGYLRCATAPRGRRGKPKRPTAYLKRGSGSGTAMRPAWRIVCDKGR